MNVPAPSEDGVLSVVPLSGLVGSATDEPFADAKAVVDYVGTLQSSMFLQGNVDTSNKYVSFRIGVRGARALIARPNAMYRVDTSMVTSEEVRKMCSDMGQRNASMPHSWERMDLFGVVRRLAMGVAAYSVWGGLTAAELRGGGNCSVSAVAAAIAPIAADAGAVFVSVKTADHARPNILAALANAISGEGGTMFTDLLGIDLTGAVKVPVAQDAGLAQGCHDALRVLGAQFRSCGKGAFFALAVTQGIHRIKSVHGHSDEGAYVRDVFRALEAGVPYGAIVSDIARDNALPEPHRSVSGFRAVYDAVALATAGAVALSDPMVDFGGRDYPTVLVTDQGEVTDPGTDNAGTAADAADLSTQWAESCGSWAALYARALNKIFATDGGEREVVRHLTSQADSLSGQDNRHLRLKVAVAFCWIEPSASCPVAGVEFPAFAANHGPLAIGSASRVVPALDGCALLTDKSDNMRSTMQIDFRFARRHGLFVHLGQHVRNGLGSITLDAGVVENFVLVGGAGDLGPRVLARNALSSYLWGRGHSAIIAPGELVNLDQSLVMTFQHVAVTAGLVMRNTHVPRARELVEGDVTYSVSRLVGSSPAAPDEIAVRAITRSRCRAAIALSMAADSERHGSVINDQLMRPMLVDFGPLPASAYSRSDRLPVPEERAAGTSSGAELGPSGGRVERGAPGTGPIAPITREYRSDRGPRLPQTGPIRGAAPPSRRGAASGGFPPVGGPGGGPPAPGPDAGTGGDVVMDGPGGAVAGGPVSLGGSPVVPTAFGAGRGGGGVVDPRTGLGAGGIDTV